MQSGQLIPAIDKHASAYCTDSALHWDYTAVPVQFSGLR
jgi:hypothetical protein